LLTACADRPLAWRETAMNMMSSGFSAPGFKTLNANGHLIHYAEHGAGWRYDTLLEKEPETIEWIDTFAAGETLWDIGANVGIYSIYAGVKGIRTFAFEPHFANYHQLCVSVAVNSLEGVVTPLCLAFAEKKAVSEMNLASLEIGTSMSNFGEALDFRGKAFEPAFRQGMIGYDLDSFVADFGVEVPDHIKIDVDGIELAIVAGAQKTLADPKLQSVSIELIETDMAQVDAVNEIMARAGLHFIHKKQNLAFSTADTTDVLNFLYHRDPAALAARLEEGRGETAPATVEEGEDVTTDELIARIVQRIRGAAIDNVPSPNIFMEDMLPAHVYRELLARLPNDSALDPIIHPDAITADGRRTRYLLDLTPESLERLEPADRPFWEAMIAVFTAPEVTQAIIEKYEPTLRARFGDAMPELIAVPILYRDFPGYRIGIHHDTARKIATMQFYLPEDESQLHLGTTFHCRTADGFRRHKTNDFAPNSAYSFVRSEESWHSVDELGASEKVRNTIALTFYIKGQEYRSDPMAAKAAAPIESQVYDADMRQALQSLAKTFNRPEDIASLFRVDGTGVELGVGAGELSERILARADIGHLYSIAPWCGEYGQGVEQYRDAVVRLSPHRARNTILRMHGNDALSLFGDGSLDFLYINGFAHDGERDGQMLRTWFAKLRSGGIVAGDDCAPQWPLVVTAVNDFAAAYGLDVHMAFCQDEPGRPGLPAWFAMKP
jgi:FkbM family methyltransferase